MIFFGKKKTNNLKSFKLTWKNYRFFPEQRIFSNKLLNKNIFLPNQRYPLTNDFTELPFNEKTNRIDRKLKIILITNEITFLEQLNKSRNGLFTNDKQTKWKKLNMPIFSSMRSLFFWNDGIVLENFIRSRERTIVLQEKKNRSPLHNICEYYLILPTLSEHLIYVYTVKPIKLWKRMTTFEKYNVWWCFKANNFISSFKCTFSMKWVCLKGVTGYVRYCIK